MKTVIVTIIALAIIGSVGYLVAQSGNDSSPAPTTSRTVPSPHSAATITFDGTRFSPADVEVLSGSTVAIKNTSSQKLQMDSDPHPVHSDDPDLNVGKVGPGQQRTFTVHKTGSFGYHDHLDPGIRASITVQ